MERKIELIALSYAIHISIATQSSSAQAEETNFYILFFSLSRLAQEKSQFLEWL